MLVLLETPRVVVEYLGSFARNGVWKEDTLSTRKQEDED